MKYAIGKIVNTHGVKGEVKILSDTDFDRFTVGSKITVENKEYVIKTLRNQNQYLLVSFENLTNLNDVLHLKGKTIYTNQKPTITEEDEFYLPDLIGLKVFNTQDELLGSVESVIEVPQGHLLSIRKTNGKKALVPFVSEFVKEVDEDKIIIQPIEGLI